MKPATRVRVGIFSSYVTSHFVPSIRLFQPLSLLKRYLDVDYSTDDNLPSPLQAYDLFIIQRNFPAKHFNILEKIHQLGKPLLFEIDDDLFDIPPDHPEYPHYGSASAHLKKALPLFSGVITSTVPLSEKVRTLVSEPTPVHLFPNFLPLSLWQTLSRLPKNQDAPISIGFSGTVAHIEDLKLIESALLRIAHEFSGRVEIVLWGAHTENLRACDAVRIVKSWVEYFDYPAALAELGLDIGIAPLADTEFNRCKSDLKFLEYAALGIPAVVSDVAPFAQVKAADAALVVPNDAEAWYRALVTLIEDAALRRALGERAYDYLSSQRNLEHNVVRYAEILNHYLPSDKHLPLDSFEVAPLMLPTREERYVPADEYQAWLRRRTLQEADAEVLAERMLSWPEPPQITLLSIARADDFAALADTADALQQQLYPHWRWIVVSDHPAPDPVFEETPFLGWLHLASLDEPQAVAEVLNALLPDVAGDVLAMLPPGFRLAPEALCLVAEAFVTNEKTAVVYSDHDHWDGYGRLRVHFKPDYDPIRFYQHDYLGSSRWYRCSALRAIGGVQPYPGAELDDALWRLVEAGFSVAHLREPLVTIPLSAAYTASESARTARQLALTDHLARTRQAIEVRTGALPNSFRLEWRLSSLPSVSVIVPIGNVYHLTAACLTSLLEKTAYDDWELVVIDHATDDPDIAALLQDLSARFDRVRIVRDDGPYALARLYNVGAATAQGEVLVFLHADTQIVQPEWLQRLVAWAAQPDVAVVAPLVLQPESGFIEQAGLWLGGAPEPWSCYRAAYAGETLRSEGYLGDLLLVHEVSAVGSVALATRRDVFAANGGFDEQELAIAGFEVDYCLKARQRGKRVLLQPESRLVHQGGAMLSRLLAAEEDPFAAMQHQKSRQKAQRALLLRWKEALFTDPFFSECFSYADTKPKLDLIFIRSWQRHHDNRRKVLGFPVSGGSGQYRVRLPLRALIQAGWVQAESVPEQIARLPSVTELGKIAPTTVLLHQRLGPENERAVKAWRQIFPELRVVFGMDDRLDAVPRKSSVYELTRRANPDARAKLRRMIALCDAVVVSTKPLQELVEEIAGTSKPIHVIPNAIDWNTWSNWYRPRMPFRIGKPRVGWVGAMQHRGDLELLIPVIQATHEEIDWVFFGMRLPEFEHLLAEKHDWVSFEEYPRKMAQLDLDLAVAPLEDNEFNRAKSNLRLIEYGALGYPVICSDVEPYRENSPPVFRIPNVPELWIEKIKEKVCNQDLFIHSHKIRNWVKNHYTLDKFITHWHEILQ